MTIWTTSADLAAQVQKYWDSGRILADRLDADSRLFPLRLRLRKPVSQDLTDHFEAVRNWVAELVEHERKQRGHGYEIQWRTFKHRVRGRNSLPATITIPSADDALRLIGKIRETQRFDQLANDLFQEFPELRNWLTRRPLEALRRIDEWPQLMAVLRHFRRHPRPGIYLRQLDIPAVDTKFIEARRGLVGQLLDEILPEDAIDADASGARNFNRRFGLLSPPVLVRFRILDPALALALSGLTDLSVPASEFDQLDLPVDEVFITENEINGLAFPKHPRAIVIFGLGYGLERLAGVDWLARARCWYWGDIDTHGFAILNRLRHYLPQARSFLMDRATLDGHRELWGREPKEHRFLGVLNHLDDEEQSLYQALRDDCLADRLRLEQEHIRFAWLQDFLDDI